MKHTVLLLCRGHAGWTHGMVEYNMVREWDEHIWVPVHCPFRNATAARLRWGSADGKTRYVCLKNCHLCGFAASQAVKTWQLLFYSIEGSGARISCNL